MTILVLGVTGMLGHKVFQYLRACVPGTLGAVRGRRREPPLDRVGLLQGDDVLEGFDLWDVGAVYTRLREIRPHVIVNCVGVIKQRLEAQRAVRCLRLNALLPHELAELCATWGGRLIHFSTDCVFSGRRGGYTEEDSSDAIDLYGQTKFLGEVTSSNAVTLRTSMIGRELVHRESLLEWFLSQGRATVRGFTQAFYSGVTTNHLAEVVHRIIVQHPDLHGLYQVASATLSKFELLCLLREAFDRPTEIVPDSDFRCDRSLDGNKLRRAIGYECPPWPELVRQLARDPTPYEDWK